METLKRSAEPSPLEPPAKLRVPLDTLSEDGPLTQHDVVYFKKEAIWRQMRLYKLQASELSSEVAKYERRHQAFLQLHALLEAWYASVVQALAGETPAKVDLQAPETSVAAALETRRDTLLKLLKPAVAPGAAADSLGDVVQLRAEKEAAELSCADLRDQLAQLAAQIADLHKEKDREASKTLQRVHPDTQVKAEEEPVKTEGSPAQNGGCGSPTDADDAAFAAQKHELEALKVEFAQLSAGHGSLQERLDSVTAKLSQLESTNADLRSRLSDLSESDLLKVPRYIALVEKCNALADNLASANRVKDEVVSRVKELEDRDGTLSLSTELEEENRRLKENLAKAECDLVRVRTARDELLGKQSVLRSELDNKKTNDELLQLNAALDKRLSGLEQARQGDITSAGDAGLEQLEKPDLIKRLSILNSELKDIEQAFQEIRSLTINKAKETVDREGLVKKLTIEKNKADQKYFASMRLKDSLVTENKVLKTQVAKSQELVTKLNDLERNYVAKINVLTKSMNDYRAIKESSIHETSKLGETARQLTKLRENAAKEAHSLKEELARTRKELSDAVADLSAHKTKEARLEAKLRATENLLLKYKQNNTSSILQEDEKQLEALRSITKCSVCSKNWKNTAITVCGHVFCESCVQERLAARLRRCPTCNKGFSANDLLSIHL